MLGLILFVVVVAAIAIWVAGLYNGLVRLRLQVKNAWAQIDVQLKRRHDLIPNLVETVKGYAGHEKETLEERHPRPAAVRGFRRRRSSRAQAEAESASERRPGTPDAGGGAVPGPQGQPELPRPAGGADLHREQDRFSRQHYNDSVMTYNTRIQSVPTNIIAGMFGFKEEEFFELEDEAAREGTPGEVLIVRLHILRRV